MTVQDLIDYLNRLPKDTVIGVVYECCSDLAILEEEELKFVDAKSGDLLTSHVLADGREIQVVNPGAKFFERYVLRNGKIMEYDPKTWDAAEKPHFVPVLVFPGN